ncbi:MAG: hypothetical protein Q8N65_00585 [bacterium]|nr:hypothetical protein [bacterium]
MKIFTIEDGRVVEGVKIQNFTFGDGKITIPAILVGESGRGRQLGVLPVGSPPMAPCPDRKGYNSKIVVFWRSDQPDLPMPETHRCKSCGIVYTAWQREAWDNHPGLYPENPGVRGSRWVCEHPLDKGEVLGTLSFAEVGTTKAGKPKLWGKSAVTTNEKIIVVFRTSIGFRGGNNHTGERRDQGEQPCPDRGREYGYSVHGKCDICGIGLNEPAGENLPYTHPTDEGIVIPKPQFDEFPGEVICRGVIAQGDAGRMGAGDQLVAVMPKGVVFRTSYSGRLYGAPSSHYYKWDGEKLIGGLTWEERTSSDLF